MEILTKQQKDLLADFLNTLRNYEHESHNLIGPDERETSEFVEIYESILRKRQYDSASENSFHKHGVSVSLFDEALRMMRDLAEHQNGAPLITHEEEYNKTMTEVGNFLEANET